MDVTVEKKKGFKERWSEKVLRFKNFCSSHPDVCLTVLGGLASLAGGCLKLYANKTEYEDYLYTEVDDTVYKLPAKEMKTAKKLRKEE